MKRTESKQIIIPPKEKETCHEPALKTELQKLGQVLQDLLDRVVSLERGLWHLLEQEGSSGSDEDEY